MRVAFFGSPEAALPAFRALLESRHQIVLVVTQPDKPAGRGRERAASPVKQAALDAQLPVLQPPKVREAAAIESIASCSPDVFVVVAFGQILPQALLDVPRKGAVNVHFSLLPKYRGAAPVQWAVLNGETETGVTVMRMDAGMDTGGILAQEAVRIEEAEDAVELETRLAGIGAALLLQTLERLESTTVVEIPQDHSAATLAPKLRKDDGRLDWNSPAAQIARRLRALGRWPGVFFLMGNLTVKLLDGHAAPVVPQTFTVPLPGEVLAVEKAGVVVACTPGEAFTLTRVQPAGRTPMDVRSFVNGYRLAAGQMLS
ncbi:MAG: methionyl-tRNA formyltransferase [Acidobacteriota bacterium]